MPEVLPPVVTKTFMSWGAVQLHHTERMAALPAWAGSPDSLVAPELLTVAVKLVPVAVIRLAKLSLAGAAVMATGSPKAKAVKIPETHAGVLICMSGFNIHPNQPLENELYATEIHAG